MYNFSLRNELRHLKTNLLVILTTNLKNQLEELDSRDSSLVFDFSAKPFINIDKDDLQSCNAHLTLSCIML